MNKFDELSRKIDETPAIQLDALIEQISHVSERLSSVAEMRESLMELMAMAFIAVGLIDTRRMWYVVGDVLKISTVGDSRSISQFIQAGEGACSGIVFSGFVENGLICSRDPSKELLIELQLRLNLPLDTPVYVPGTRLGRLKELL